MSSRPAAPNRLRRFVEQRKMRRLWGATTPALMPPPPRAFAAFGSGSIIVPPGRIEGAEYISIGRRVKIQEHVWIIVRQQPGHPPPRLVIGDDTHINRFVKIVSIGEVRIGEECMIGDNCYISDTHYLFDDPTRPIAEQGLAPPRPVTLGPGCHLGFRTTIRPGVTLAESVHAGPGSVVGEDMPARSVVYGDPARVVRRYDATLGEWVFVKGDRGEGSTDGIVDVV